nr:MAG TPA: hypothetical protein [Caudoviricetes sp.]
MDMEKKEKDDNEGDVVMKLEHLLQAYKVNNIDAKLKEMNDKNEKAGIIMFANGISASYLLDNEEIVIAMKIFFNCLTRDSLTITNQISHVIKIIQIMQNTIMLLANVTQKESNMILESLGLFDNTFVEGKQIKHLEHTYKIEVIDGLLCLSINEIELTKG